MLASVEEEEKEDETNRNENEGGKGRERERERIPHQKPYIANKSYCIYLSFLNISQTDR